MKKLISILFVMVLTFTQIACSNIGDSKESNSDISENTSSVDDDGDKPILPERDMDGKNFTVLNTSWTTSKYAPLEITDIYVESSSEDGIESATYNRMLYMEDKYGCTVSQHCIVSGEEFSTILAANRSGDVPYQFCLIRSQNFATLVTAGTLCELGEIPYIDVEKPWWNKESYDSLAIINKHFGVASSITVNDELSAWAVYFNKRMIADNSLDNPYELVKDMEWTYGKVFEMAQIVSSDYNKDGKMDGNDIYGVSHIRDGLIGMINSCGVTIAQNNEEGIPEFTFTEKGPLDKIDNILSKIYKTNVCINLHNFDTGMSEGQFFMNGRSLFSFSGIYTGNELRSMDEAYGILPYPLYDENQTRYYSGTSGLFLTLMVVPNGNNELDDLGIFLEDFAWYGYKHITPEFYDVLLSQKVAYDEESREMLDFIFDNMVYDTGNIGNYGQIAEKLIWLTSTYNKNLSSFIAGELPQAEKKIENLVNAVQRWE